MVTQFARGPIQVWELSSMVPEDGQLVLGRHPDGSVEGRIGDGIATWLFLPPLGGVGTALTARLDRMAVDAIDRGAVANGVTDTTPILQGLLDNFDTVQLPPGEYMITDTLRVKTGQTLIGAGIDRTIIRASLTMPNNKNLIQSSNTLLDGTEHTNYVSNVTLAGFTIDGRGHDRDIVIPNDSHGSNIRLSTVRDSKIVNVKSVNGVLHNIDVCASQYEPAPAPGSDGDVNYVVPGPSQRVVISDCYAADSVRDDPITCHDSSDILIERCTVERTMPLGSGDQHAIEVDEGCYRVALVDCTVYDHNAGFQVKGHSNTTPARDVSLVRCRAFRCRTSFHISHANPSTLPVGKVSWAKNVSLTDCESIDPEPKPGEPADTIIEGVAVAGYRNVQIRNLILRGGSGEYANNIVLDFGCDDILIDGVYAIDVCTTDTGTGRGLITTASAYGQGSNRVTVRNVVVENSLAIPVFRATGTSTAVEVDGITAAGTAGPMIYLGALVASDHVERLVGPGYTSQIQIGADTYTGLQILPGHNCVMSGTTAPTIAAPIGTHYTRTTGGVGTTLYVKTTAGTGGGTWTAIA